MPAPSGRLIDRIAEVPAAHDPERAAAELTELAARVAADPDLAPLGPLIASGRTRELLAGVFGASPFLTSLIQRDPRRLLRVLMAEPERLFADLVGELRAAVAAAPRSAEAMQVLRTFKTDVALLTALADLAGVWPVMTVTRVLSEAADAAVATAVRFLFRLAAERGDWRPDDPSAPEQGSGYIVIAMGKHGAFELNYSSDIDLIVFYEAAVAAARLKPGLEIQQVFVRLTRELVRFLQERTADGYVFRTDLRLRPDPGAMPVAISTDAALQYYESYGQNWERAALIKARAIAGDVPAGEALIGDLAPFIWRKYLDFAAIADIHAMKRQIHAVRGFATIGVAGHNIKLGRGGIREIEFFAQTQQLIAGGRQSDLRIAGTLDALDRLAKRGWITATVARELTAAYLVLRRIEHRLQMIADEQTQTLPADPGKLAGLAHLSGFATTEAFAAALTATLECVQGHYVRLFEDSPELTAGGANMVFAGEADDPATVEALARMGYPQPAQIIATVRGWHHGRYPAVRTARARELLTEVQPLLVEALAKTADPNLAFASFDRFLSELPSGVQLFSLLRRNPNLLALIAAIMGTAPRLARILSRRRRVLDAVLDPGFFGSLPDAGNLAQIVRAELAQTRDLQEALDRARVVGNEQAFLIGVRILTGSITAGQAGGAYALLAETLIDALQAAVEAEMVRAHGRVPGGEAIVIAMGKLGGREMTAASDLDLIVVYDFHSDAVQSDGPRPLPVSQYYARYTQRLISAFTAQTAEGHLYDIDMRLRPSGQKGPVAAQFSSFVSYQHAEAWTWEHLALTRARVVSGPPGLRGRVTAAVRDVLVRPRDRARIAADVRDMRARIEAEKGTRDIWDLKQVRGGLVDVEFIAQHLQLVHAHAHPEVLDQNTFGALSKLAAAGLVDDAAAGVLLPATQLLHDLTQVLRLCLDGPFKPAEAPDGLKALLARAGDMPDFSSLEGTLRRTLSEVAALFDVSVV
ncbi:MAG: bifunctional [glutamine synthetase] adenylyltransferase/[glutamine synthetase]-adenylyl-L-tyrosine phosphorylase [Hyphomicrobiaceae bacterium]